MIIIVCVLWQENLVEKTCELCTHKKERRRRLCCWPCTHSSGNTFHQSFKYKLSVIRKQVVQGCECGGSITFIASILFVLVARHLTELNSQRVKPFHCTIFFSCTCIALHSSCLLPQSSKKNECRYGDCLNEVLLSHYYENSFHLVNRFCFCYVIGAKSRRDAASTARLKAWTYSNVWKTSIVYRNQFSIYVFEKKKQKKTKWSAEIVFQRRSRKKWNRNVKEGACARVLLWKEKVFGLFPFQAKK